MRWIRHNDDRTHACAVGQLSPDSSKHSCAPSHRGDLAHLPNFDTVWLCADPFCFYSDITRVWSSDVMPVLSVRCRGRGPVALPYTVTLI